MYQQQTSVDEDNCPHSPFLPQYSADIESESKSIHPAKRTRKAPKYLEDYVPRAILEEKEEMQPS